MLNNNHPSAQELQLSIVVPVLNEAGGLSCLLENLSTQTGVVFEVVFVDGGSVDGTVKTAYDLAATVPFSCRVISSEKGRGKQLNAGFLNAAGEMVLFLHADSLFQDPRALANGVETLIEAWEEAGHHRIAGHFALRFRRKITEAHRGYFFYEFKARLNRFQCIHGDQGFLLSREFFQEIGPFDETFPLLEDTRLADKITREGRWILLPSEIWTSARRFESEGFFSRQVLNAFIMNFATLEYVQFFNEASSVYRSQDQTGKLDLLPYFRMIQGLLYRLGLRNSIGLLYRTGAYVRSHAWQLALVVDSWQSFSKGHSRSIPSTPFLLRFERIFDVFTDNPFGRGLSALLVTGWFYSTYFFLSVRNHFFPRGGADSASCNH